MNWTRGLFRAWLVLSALWLVGCIWALDYSCFLGAEGRPWCRWWVVSPLSQSTYVHRLLVGLAPPIGVLLIGFAVLWIGRGFRSKP